MSGTVADHHDAILGLLQAGLPPFTVYDGQVPDKPVFPYAVLYMDTGTDEETKLCRIPDKAVFRFQVTSVGLTVPSALVVVDQTRARVLGVRAGVFQRVLNPIRKENSREIREDRDVTDTATKRHPCFGVDTYVFESWKD